MTALELLNQTLLGPLFCTVLGLVWGSFFNVVIARLPAGVSIARHRSRCPKCANSITWYQNIPVLSYLFLKGKCARCAQPISLQYPLVELATGGLFLWLFYRYGLSWRWLYYAWFMSSLLIITVIDLHHRIIPDELSLSGIIIGFAGSFLIQDISWQESGLGVLFGGGIFFTVAWGYERLTGREGLGGGDVKLLAMIGAWLGIKSILFVIIISSALGSIVGLSVMFIQKRDMKVAIPFGPFLAFAAAVYLFWGDVLRAFIFPEFS